ncbi:hypothetical protein AC791_00675 [Klebsiella sp. RIT-PI-d]|uniref:hypothetical protein n=1 Tax=Klebsiella sp. RIT-PI-d TaxID=1681196 RepID=UPI000675BB79|nr:hypothetical protein [Klebsiella sp. RIT-PI-d]KNC11893.1 hypothetical protein AC791_00675 [Klebsiella sp. RIT-PI-d]
MSTSDEDKKGYIAIGETVVSHIFDKEEISRESLILKLDQQAEQETNEDHLAEIAQGRSILERLEDPRAHCGDNAVDPGDPRQTAGHSLSEGNS